MGAQTRIDLALKMAKTEMFKKENGARAGLPRVLVLLTDGAQTGDGATDPAIPAQELRDAGVYLVVIGIGAGVSPDELKKIAGKDGKYFTPTSFDELITDKFIQSISQTTCPGK